MANKRTQIEFVSKISPVKPLNDEFTLCKCYVMALDKNRNLSFISKDAAEAAMPTLFNIPVIGHLYVDESGNYHMGGHDFKVVKNEDGKYEFKSICVPYGVVPSQDTVGFEDVQEPNGDVHTYLCADVILWTGRFPELHEAIYNDNTYFGQSMEINVDNYEPLEEDKNYTNILDYTYSALCLLGKSDNPDEHVEPCFPMSRVDPYEFSVNDDKFSELMTQLKKELSFCLDNAGKGGECMNDNTNLTGVTHSADGISCDQSGAPTDNQHVAEDFGNDAQQSVVATEKFGSTYKEKREAIRNALPGFTEYDQDGNVLRDVSYWLCDFDDTYAFVERGVYTRGEDYDESKGRFSYVFNDEEKTATVSGEFEEMYVRWLTKAELDSLESMRATYEELVEYKNSRMKADREAEFDAAIAEFEYLAENEEYQSVYKNRYSYETVEDMKNACYMIKGKYSISAPTRKPSVDPSVPVGTVQVALTPREKLHERYGRK